MGDAPRRALTLRGTLLRRISLAITLLSTLFGDIAYGQTEAWDYPVKPGDTLIGIGKKYLADPEQWPQIQTLNAVENPRKLMPYRTLSIPVELLKSRPLSARLIAVQGRVEIAKGSSASNAVSPLKQSLQTGDRVSIGPDSSATIEFQDGSRALLLSDTTLGITDLSTRVGPETTNTILKLDAGRLETRVTPLRKRASKYEVRTPIVNMGVRGTDFRVAIADDAQAARAEVLEGGVAAVNPLGRVDIAKGEGTVSRPNAPPAPPVALLPAPDLSLVVSRVERLPVRFKWLPMSDAVGYRVQFARSGQFDAVISEGTFAVPEAKFADLPDGRYTIRVRAVANNNLEGFNTTKEIEVKARPEPPFLQTPDNNGVVRGVRPVFEWTSAADAATYWFQLASSEDFQAPLVSSDGLRAATTSATLPPGQYYWRVASRRADGDLGPFGDSQSFTLKAIPQVGDGGTKPTVSDTALSMRWKAGDPGQKYQLQLARTADFSAPIRDVVLDQPEMELPRPVGTLYSRVRIIDSDGFIGPYSSAQRIQLPTRYPQLKVSLDPDKATLSWPPLLSGQKLHLQFARANDFQKTLIDTVSEQQSVTIRRPIGGQYFARVALVDTDATRSPFSDAWPVEVATVYPKFESPLIERQTLKLMWSPLRPNEKLHVQLARDNEFKNLIHDDVHEDTQFQLQRPESGDYYLRSAVVDSTGTQSPFSRPAQFQVPRQFPWPVLLVLPLLFLL